MASSADTDLLYTFYSGLRWYVWRFPFIGKGCLPMSPRLTDWTLALAAALALATGLLSLLSGRPQDALIFILHGVVGLWLLLLLLGKLRRVWPRLVQPRRWNRRTLFGA